MKKKKEKENRWDRNIEEPEKDNVIELPESTRHSLDQNKNKVKTKNTGNTHKEQKNREL
jgi:non-homologous end joining protein Ku